MKFSSSNCTSADEDSLSDCRCSRMSLQMQMMRADWWAQMRAHRADGHLLKLRQWEMAQPRDPVY